MIASRDMNAAPKDRPILLFERDYGWQVGKWDSFHERWETPDLQCGGTAAAFPVAWAELPADPE